MRKRMCPLPKADPSRFPSALAQTIGKVIRLHAADIALAPSFVRRYDARTQLRRRPHETQLLAFGFDYFSGIAAAACAARPTGHSRWDAGRSGAASDL